MTARGHLSHKDYVRKSQRRSPKPHLGRVVSVAWREDQLAAMNALAAESGAPFAAVARQLVDVALTLKRINAEEASRS